MEPIVGDREQNQLVGIVTARVDQTIFVSGDRVEQALDGQRVGEAEFHLGGGLHTRHFMIHL